MKKLRMLFMCLIMLLLTPIITACNIPNFDLSGMIGNISLSTSVEESNEQNESITESITEEISFDFSDVDLPEERPNHGKDDSLSIHYRRADNYYECWSLWIWKTDGSEGKQYLFNYKEDGYVVASYKLSDFNIDLSVEQVQVGFIVAKNPGTSWDEKDIEVDRFVDFSLLEKDENNAYHIYIYGGDSAVYKNKNNDILTPAIKSPIFDVKVEEVYEDGLFININAQDPLSVCESFQFNLKLNDEIAYQSFSWFGFGQIGIQINGLTPDKDYVLEIVYIEKKTQKIMTYETTFIVSTSMQSSQYDAIVNSLRGDNVSCSFYIADEKGNQLYDTWSINMEKDFDKVHVYSKEIPEMNYFIKDVASGCEMYEDGKYVKVEDSNPNLFTMIPVPNFESVLYTNYGIYQDGVGQIVDIIALHIDELYYDEKTEFYKIDNIYIEHGYLDSYYLTEPDKLTINVSFKISENGQYVESFVCNILSSELGVGGISVRMDFYNYNSTYVELP